MSSLSLPPHFLSCVAYHDRGYFECGGWLLARASAPNQVVIATGPGPDSDRARMSIALERNGVDEAAALNGFVLVGDWHSHPQGEHALKASPADLEAWRHQLDYSKSLQVIDRWHGVVVVREKGRTEAIRAWAIQRNGTCEPVPLPPITDQARALAGSLSFSVGRGPLLDPPSKWEPGAIHRELARLDLDAEMHERVRLADLNERLERLGLPGLRPLSRVPATAHVSPAVGSERPVSVGISGHDADLLEPGISLDELGRRWKAQHPHGTETVLPAGSIRRYFPTTITVR